MPVFKLPPDDKRLTLDNMQDLFMQYDPKQGPLEAILGRSVSNFNRGQAPSAPAESIPGAPKTEIPRMDITDFAMPVGRGSWFNRPADSASFTALIQKQRMMGENAESEKGRVQLFMKAFPTEFSGHSPEEFASVKEAQAALKLIQDNSLRRDTLAEKKRKAQEEAEIKRRKLNPPSPFAVPGQQAQAAPAKTASDVLGKFGL